MMEISGQHANQFSSIDWTKCVFCQENTSERRECPANSKESNHGAGYATLQKDLQRFSAAGELHLELAKLDEGEGIPEMLLNHNASWHKSCRVQYNSTKFEGLMEWKRKVNEGNALQHTDCSGKYTRAELACTPVGQDVCFFCGALATDGNSLSRASTVELDKRVRAVAIEINDFNLLGQLTARDMVALKSQYNIQCLVALYARSRQQPDVSRPVDSTPHQKAF